MLINSREETEEEFSIWLSWHWTRKRCCNSRELLLSLCYLNLMLGQVEGWARVRLGFSVTSYCFVSVSKYLLSFSLDRALKLAS